MDNKINADIDELREQLGEVEEVPGIEEDQYTIRIADELERIQLLHTGSKHRDYPLGAIQNEGS